MVSVQIPSPQKNSPSNFWVQSIFKENANFHFFSIYLQTNFVSLLHISWPSAFQKVGKPRCIAAYKGPFGIVLWNVINFLGRTVDFCVQDVTRFLKAIHKKTHKKFREKILDLTPYHIKMWSPKKTCFSPFTRSLLIRDYSFFVLFLSYCQGTYQQGCISRLTCSYPELTKDHVLTSAYVKFFRTVTKNAVNNSA